MQNLRRNLKYFLRSSTSWNKFLNMLTNNLVHSESLSFCKHDPIFSTWSKINLIFFFLKKKKRKSNKCTEKLDKHKNVDATQKDKGLFD